MTKEPIYGIMDVERACSISKGDGKLKVAIYCRLSEEDRNKQFVTDRVMRQCPHITLKELLKEMGFYEITT